MSASKSFDRARHVVRDAAAPFLVVVRVQGAPQAILLGQHTDEQSLGIAGRRAGNPLIKQNLHRMVDFFKH